MKEIIERMRNRIMEHKKENGFETVYDFLNEDLDKLEEIVNNWNCGYYHIDKKIHINN